jgi:hypothetical protein
MSLQRRHNTAVEKKNGLPRKLISGKNNGLNLSS